MATILVVDDSTTVRTQLRAFLETQGFVVLEAENGSVGVSMVETHGPDLAIIDVNMPVLGGIEAVRRIRALPKNGRLPIFMLTTETSAQLAKESKTAGATAWMVKPCNFDALARGIEAVLKRTACA